MLSLRPLIQLGEDAVDLGGRGVDLGGAPRAFRRELRDALDEREGHRLTEDLFGLGVGRVLAAADLA